MTPFWQPAQNLFATITPWPTGGLHLIARWLLSTGRFGTVVRVLMFIPVVTPMVANAMVWKLMLNGDGLVNSLLATVGVEPLPWLTDGKLAMASLILMSLWQGIGYNIIVLTAGLNAINPSLRGPIDGAAPTVIFFCT